MLELRVLVQYHGLVVIKTLLLQEPGQIAFVAVGLFQLGSLVLKPDLDLIVIQAELLG